MHVMPHLSGFKMSKVTLILDAEQKAIMLQALEKYVQFTLGQTAGEAEVAREMHKLFARVHKHETTIDLTQ